MLPPHHHTAAFSKPFFFTGQLSILGMNRCHHWGVLRALLAILFIAMPARAEISKGDRIFMKRGLFMHALCFHDHLLHLDTLKNCGFTGVTWPFTSNMKQLGPPPGLPWCRW